MQKTLSQRKGRGHQAGTRIVLAKSTPSRSSFSKHGQPRGIVLTCAILWSCFLQLFTSQTKKPILIDSIFSQPDKLQLCFRPMGNYAASTFISHVRILFDYSVLHYLQNKMIKRIDCCIPDLDRFNFKLDQYNRATLNSTFELYKSDIRQVFKLFHDLLASLPHVQECQQLSRYDISLYLWIWNKGFHNLDPPRKRTIKTRAFWRQNYSSRLYFGNDSSHTISRSWFSIRIEAFYVRFKLMYYDE